MTDLAGDDHHVEVYRGHYGHGTTAHVLADPDGNEFCVMARPDACRTGP
ncbi:hypothetical protein ACFXKS_12710 [Streptomyces scopuliridis]